MGKGTQQRPLPPWGGRPPVTQRPWFGRPWGSFLGGDGRIFGPKATAPDFLADPVPPRTIGGGSRMPAETPLARMLGSAAPAPRRVTNAFANPNQLLATDFAPPPTPEPPPRPQPQFLPAPEPVSVAPPAPTPAAPAEPSLAAWQREQMGTKGWAETPNGIMRMPGMDSVLDDPAYRAAQARHLVRLVDQGFRLSPSEMGVIEQHGGLSPAELAKVKNRKYYGDPGWTPTGG